MDRGGEKEEREGHEIAKRRQPFCASISFPPDIYETLEVIAKEKKVSLAWVVREAAEKYIEDKWPLFFAGRMNKADG